MADWYLKATQEGESEQSRLARILDLAQDLKVKYTVVFCSLLLLDNSVRSKNGARQFQKLSFSYIVFAKGGFV
jgi:hypothetical protein